MNILRAPQELSLHYGFSPALKRVVGQALPVASQELKMFSCNGLWLLKVDMQCTLMQILVLCNQWWARRFSLADGHWKYKQVFFLVERPLYGISFGQFLPRVL